MADTTQVEAKQTDAKQTQLPTKEQILAKYRERLNFAPADQQVSRRGFLAVLVMGWGLFTIAVSAGALALFRAMIPNVDFTKVEKVKVGPPDRFSPNSVNQTFEPYKIWIVRDPEKIVALRSICTHLGCTPNWMPNDDKFKCPCHGSGFRGPGGGYLLAGYNFEGPAPMPLLRFRIYMGDDGQLVVDKGTVYDYSKGEWSNPESYHSV